MEYAKQVGTLMSMLARLTDSQRAYVLGYCCGVAPDVVTDGLAKLQLDEFFEDKK